MGKPERNEIENLKNAIREIKEMEKSESFVLNNVRVYSDRVELIK